MSDLPNPTVGPLPCPFCGEVPDVNNPATFHHEIGDRWARIACCIEGPEIRAGIYTPVEEWKDDAIAAWNERPIEATLQSRIAELERANAELEAKLVAVSRELINTDNADRYYRGFNDGYDLAESRVQKEQASE